MVEFLTSILSKIRSRRNLRGSFGKIRNYLGLRFTLKRVYISLVVASLLVYFSLVWTFPEFLRNEVISEITLAYLTVEGILLGLVYNLRDKERNLGVVLGVVGIVSSLSTMSVSLFQSIQLGYLSWFPTTLLFKVNGGFFLFFLEYYAFGLFLPFRGNPEETEP